MSQIADNVRGDTVIDEDSGLLEARMLRVMSLSVIVAVAISATFAPWRITTGLAVGGGLSLLNYHWLRTSVRALLNDATVKRPTLTITRYVFRYLIIGGAVFALYMLNVISLPAALIGLCALVPALFVEAFRQVYFIIIHREGTY